MKVKTFTGVPSAVEIAFNSWAKGKALTRDVIIHSVYLPVNISSPFYCIAIFVYYPEGSPFDTED